MNTSKPPEGFEKLTVKNLLWPNVLAILKKNHAPEHWGERETHLLLDWFFIRKTADAIKLTKKPDGTPDFFIPGFPDEKGKMDRLQYERLVRTLMFAKMFADAPQTMIKSLPEIQKLMSVSPMRAMAFEAVVKVEVAKTFGKKLPTEFWTKKPTELAPKDGTPKTVEHAREFLKKLVSPKVSRKKGS